MLSLAKQHLQQRAQSQQQLQRSAQQQQQQQQSQRVPSHKAALADFPLAAPTQAKGKGKKAGKAAAAALQKPAFAAKAARRAASSKAVLKRAKLLARKMPRPSLLERAERALADATPDATAITARNERILSHESDRKLKTQAAMKKVRGQRMRPDARDGVLQARAYCNRVSAAHCCLLLLLLLLLLPLPLLLRHRRHSPTVRFCWPRHCHRDTPRRTRKRRKRMMSEMTSMTQSSMSSWINREACAACAHSLSTKNRFSLFAIRIHFASACLKQSERVFEQ